MMVVESLCPTRVSVEAAIDVQLTHTADLKLSENQKFQHSAKNTGESFERALKSASLESASLGIQVMLQYGRFAHTGESAGQSRARL
jgi:hypothetical protein